MLTNALLLSAATMAVSSETSAQYPPNIKNGSANPIISSAPPNNNTNVAASAASISRPPNAADPAAKMITEDERRMKFLALLCGSGAFPRTDTSHGLDGTNNNSSNGVMISNGRPRSGSIGKVMVGESGVANSNDGNAMDIDLPQQSVDGKHKGKNATTSAASSSAAAAAARSAITHNNDEPNYTPTTPHNLSRRLLHKSSVGYLDDSVPLLTSALSDRFLATVLVQAMACRDRRIEGYKATLRQRKRRLRHRRRVLRERESRDELTMKKLKVKQGNKGGEDYGKMVEDVDKEEEYYDSYFKGNGDNDEGKKQDGIGEDYNSEEDDEDDVSDDELIDESMYDLKLRDLVRPLSAWGFDLTGKMGFHGDSTENTDRKLQEDDDDSASDGDDLDEEEENEDGDNNDESDGDLMTDDEAAGNKSTASSPTKKKKNVAASKTKKTTATKKKKAATAKRKRADEEGGDGKEDDSGKPKAKKASTEASKKPPAADKK